MRAAVCLLVAAFAWRGHAVQHETRFPVPPSANWQQEFGQPVSAAEAVLLREEVREMVRSRRQNLHTKRVLSAPTTCTQFSFTYDNYMRHAFPKDELRPLSCSGAVRRQSHLCDATSRLWQPHPRAT
jgi:hypothetical protein